MRIGFAFVLVANEITIFQGRELAGEREKQNGEKKRDCRSHKINVITRDAFVRNNRNGGRKNELRDEGRACRSRERGKAP